MNRKFKIGSRVTDGKDSGVVVNQYKHASDRGRPKRILVTWDREYKGHKQTGYPLAIDLTNI